MAITFPREMLTRGAALQEFEVQRVDYQSPEAGGLLGGVQAGFPLWLGMWDLGKFGAKTSDDWRAWVASLRGMQRPFYGRDIARPYPLAHINGLTGLTRAGGGSFTGAATSWSQSIVASGDSIGNAVVELNGLPANFVLSSGDYIGFKWDQGGFPTGNHKRRALVRVVEAVTGNGSGVAAVTVEPPVPTLVVPSGAIAHVDNPACVMKLVTDQSRLAGMDRRLAIGGGKIVGLQDLRP